MDLSFPSLNQPPFNSMSTTSSSSSSLLDNVDYNEEGVTKDDARRPLCRRPHHRWSLVDNKTTQMEGEGEGEGQG